MNAPFARSAKLTYDEDKKKMFTTATHLSNNIYFENGPWGGSYVSSVENYLFYIGIVLLSGGS